MPPEKTPDGHYVIIDGRRWHAGDAGAEAQARARVHAAKVARGEVVGARALAAGGAPEPAPARRVADV